MAACLTSLLAGSLVAEAQTEGLVTWLTFDEAWGSVAADSSGAGNHGTLLNMADANKNWFFGRHRGALYFDGVNDYVRITNRIGGSFTISVWIQTTQTMPVGDNAYQGKGLVWSDVGGTANDFTLGLTRSTGGVNRVSFFAGGPSTAVNGTSEISTGWWKHIAVTRDQTSGAIKLYVDGALEAQGTGGTNVLSANPSIAVGGNTRDGRYFAGNVDDLRLYDRVLSAGEIAGLATIIPTNLLASYFMFTNDVGPRTLVMADTLSRAVSNVVARPDSLARLNAGFGKATQDCIDARALFDASVPGDAHFGFGERNDLCDASVFHGIARRARDAGAAISDASLNTLSNELVLVTLSLADALFRAGNTNVDNTVGQGAIMQALAVLYDWNRDSFSFAQRTNIVSAMLRYSIIPNFNAVLALPSNGDHRFWATEEVGNWATIMAGGPVFCALAIRRSDYDGSFACWNGLGAKLTRPLREHFDAYLPVVLSMFRYGYDFLERANGTMHEGTGYHHDGVFPLFGLAASLEGAQPNPSNAPVFLQEFAGHTRVAATNHVHAGIHFASPAGGEFTYNDGTWRLTTEPVNFLVAEWARQMNSPSWRGGAWQAFQQAGGTWSGMDHLWGSYFDWSASTNAPEGMLGFDPTTISPAVFFYRSKTAYHGQAGSDEFIAIWRQRWNDSAAAALMFKGGDKRKDLHDHLDTATFHYEAQGVRWTAEIGSAEGYPGISIGGKSTSYQTYPKRAMAHNTLVINPTRNDYVNGSVHPLWTEVNPDQAVEDGISDHWAPVEDLQADGGSNVWSASVNLSAAYARHGLRAKTQGAPDDSRRWFSFDRTTGDVVVEDSLHFAQADNEVFWHLHVGSGSVPIHESTNRIVLRATRSDGKPAYLSVRLEATSATESSGLRYVTPLEYLPGEQPSNLWTFADAANKTNWFRKIVLHSVTAGTSLETRVRLQPHPELTGESSFTARLRLGLLPNMAALPGDWPFNASGDNAWGGYGFGGDAALAFTNDRVEGTHALSFDGTGSVAVSEGEFDPGDTFTMGAWVKLPAGASGSQTLAAHGAGGAGFRLFVNSPATSDRALALENGDGTSLLRIASSPGLIPTDAWTHVAAVVKRSSGTARLFVNGTNVTCADLVHTNVGHVSALTLGAPAVGAPTNRLRGLLDEAHLLPRAMTAMESNALRVSGLTNRWTFNVDTRDVTGRGPAFTPRFGAALGTNTPARVGVQALALDGNDDGAESAAPVPLGSQFTFAAWVFINTNRYSMQTLLCNRTPTGSTDGIFLYANAWHTTDRKLILDTSNGSNALSIGTVTQAMPFGEWVHVAATLDRAAGQAKLFINGTQAASGTIRTDFQTTNLLWLGSLGPVNGDGRYRQNLQGGLEDVRLYGRVLNAAEIALLSGRPDAAPTLTGFEASATNATVGATVTVSATGADSDTTFPLRYSFVWGDESAPTPWSTNRTASHAYGVAGQYAATARVDDGTTVATRPITLTVAPVRQPPLVRLSNQVIMAGLTLALSGYATNVNENPQPLSYSLREAPAGAGVDPASGAIAWRPPMERGGTSNRFTVVVAESGGTMLSTTQSFWVAVFPPPPPSLGALPVLAGQITLRVEGAYGPDYALLATTNIVDDGSWATVCVTNAPALPWYWSDPDPSRFPQRFYRIQLGP